MREEEGGGEGRRGEGGREGGRKGGREGGISGCIINYIQCTLYKRHIHVRTCTLGDFQFHI